ncbi:hypothetical protein HPP92_017835 [Vanilla planifolia]|uniref:Uncharacterized protein n=1 Tax=Vanilla planifolia TaxID=51239 RepID=A0A835QIS8_VANPL|nr:hypothetical protein HPP92_017835 [Vanilla planifolia]
MASIGDSSEELNLQEGTSTKNWDVKDHWMVMMGEVLEHVILNENAHVSKSSSAFLANFEATRQFGVRVAVHNESKLKMDQGSLPAKLIGQGPKNGRFESLLEKAYIRDMGLKVPQMLPNWSMTVKSFIGSVYAIQVLQSKQGEIDMSKVFLSHSGATF